MLQNEIEVTNRYNRFLRTAAQSELVYALKNEDGFATSDSNDMENDAGEPATLICFWSDAARAKACIADEWAEYEVEAIELASFIENWCVGMHNDELLMGINFDQNLFGFEAPPLKVMLDIIAELKSLDKDLELRKFDDIRELESKAREIMEG